MNIFILYYIILYYIILYYIMVYISILRCYILQTFGSSLGATERLREAELDRASWRRRTLALEEQMREAGL